MRLAGGRPLQRQLASLDINELVSYNAKLPAGNEGHRISSVTVSGRADPAGRQPMAAASRD